MRSDTIKRGDARKHRSLLRATGVGEGDWNKPFIARLQQPTSTSIPGHVHLRGGGQLCEECCTGSGRRAVSVRYDRRRRRHRDGPRRHGRFSLPSRELIADCVETMIQGHCFECDGLHSQLRQDRAAHVHGGDAGQRPDDLRLRRPDGSQAARRRERPSIAIDAFVAGVQKQNGQLSAEELDEIEKAACPDVRQLLGNVHRQQHELPGRGDRPGTSRQRSHPGDLGRSQGALRKAPAHGGSVAMAREFARKGAGHGLPAPRDRESPAAFDNADGPRHGDGRKHQHRPPHPGDRPRSRRAVLPLERIDQL